MLPHAHVRPFRTADAAELRQLFFDTVHTINIRDYAPNQVNAWAPRDFDGQRWEQSFATKTTFVAEADDTLVGFGELETSGHIDRFYCHADFQGQGIGSLLLGHIENQAREWGLKQLYLEASITAQPFFERRGFRLVKEQEVECRGVTMTNFVMEKMLNGISL